MLRFATALKSPKSTFVRSSTQLGFVGLSSPLNQVLCLVSDAARCGDLTTRSEFRLIVDLVVNLIMDQIVNQIYTQFLVERSQRDPPPVF